MQTIIIRIIEDIVIEKGTIVPDIKNCYWTIPYTIELKSGDELRHNGVSGIVIKPTIYGFVNPKSYFGENELFDYMCNVALKNRSIKEIKKEYFPIFCVFETTKEKILNPYPFHNYIEAKDYKEARQKTKQIYTQDFFVKHSLPKNFEYTIFEWTKYLLKKTYKIL